MVNIILLLTIAKPFILLLSNKSFYISKQTSNEVARNNKGNLMLGKLFILSYRLLAISVLIIPVIINIIFKGDIVVSLLYLPLLSLILSLLFIHVDQQLCHFFNALKLKQQPRSAKNISTLVSTSLAKKVSLMLQVIYAHR